MTAAGVQTREIDKSTRVASSPGVYTGLLLPAKKGTVGVPTLITKDTDFLKLYTPNGKIEVGMDLAHFSALVYLETGDKLWVTRVASGALYGGFVVKQESSTYDNFALISGMEDPSTYMFDMSADVTGVAEVTEVTTVDDVSGSLGGTYFTFSTLASDGVTETLYYVWFNTGSSVDPAVVGATGIPVSITADDSADAVASAVHAAITGIDAVTEVSANVVTITNTNAGSVTNASAGTSGFSISVSTEGVTEVTDEDEALFIYARNEGAWANDIAIKIIHYSEDPDYVKEEGAFIIEVYKRGDLVNALESHICSRNPSQLDGFNRSIFVESVLESSSYIRARSNDVIDSSVLPKSIPTPTYLAGGDDGVAPTDADFVQALSAFENEDSYPLSLMMCGGRSTVVYHQALISLCTQRGNVLPCMSVPYAAEASSDYLAEIADYRQNQLLANTSFGSIYTSYVKYYDKFNDRSIYLAPDCFAAAAICFSFANYEIWYPPAGWKRGQVSKALDLRRRYTKGELGYLYNIGVNPLRFQPGKGIVIWGQKTLLARASALDRINVRLLINEVKTATTEFLETFTFDLSNEGLWEDIVTGLTPYFNDIEGRNGVYEYQIICDESNNSPEDLDNYRLNVDVYLKPTKAAEFIKASMIITRTGVSFSDVSI